MDAKYFADNGAAGCCDRWHGNYGSSKETVKLDISIKSVHNRIYVPLRFVSEQYGYKVGWANHTVSIQSPLYEKERVALYAGNLAAARKIAMSAMFAGGHYEPTPLQTLHRTENYDTEFLSDRTGPTPRIDKTFLYYDSGFAGPARWVRSGRVGTDGKVEQTAVKITTDGKVTDYIGTIALTLPKREKNGNSRNTASI
ncbi:stalk domain-containing protein [Paenibacillus sediminis]|uniref:Copper amine oxidase-like N-terminal domain-containing protein n=1 Tax=Paenibacillus sediminis TaxID=664909 RepID=A0ABS4H3Z2_9BACL|nr:hypothetical protein [Paenibacillus sediminis]